MVKATLKSIDIKIANIIGLVVFYEALNLSLVSLLDGDFPVGHDHLLVTLLHEGKTTFAKEAKKLILNQIDKITQGKVVSRRDVIMSIHTQIQTHRKKLDTLIYTRESMQNAIKKRV